MTCDSMLLQSKSNACTGEVMRTSTSTHPSDGNLSDASSSMPCENRGDGSLSSATEWTNERRLDVTRAASKCSMTDDADDGVSRIVYGLDTKSSWCAHSIPTKGEKKGDRCGDLYKNRPKETAPNLFEDMGDMLHCQSSFAQEALGRLRDISNESPCRMPQEDPTFALQNRLQKLLLAAVLEHECPAHSGSQLGFEDAWDTSDRFGTAWKDKRCLTDSVAHREELELTSLKAEKAKMALASQKGESHSCFRRHAQQTVAEEMYCKETIRQIVQQVQVEIEQWSQMQGILHTLQEELEGLSELQKLWEDRALQAEDQLKCLQEEVHEWRYRARSSEKELVILRCEKQILKDKIDMIEDAHMNPSGIREVEKPRCASVGTQHEDFGLCESFVHSRNESGRSSVDLGTSTQKSFRKSIKKSLDFVSNKNSSNPSKFLFGNFGMPKIETTGLEFSSKKVDVFNSKGKPKSYKSSGHCTKLNTPKLDSSESTYGHDYKERKKARLFASKENRSFSANVSSHFPSLSENMQDGLLGHVVNAGQDYTDHLILTKPKSSLPSAPASTPSRIPFGDIVNIHKHNKY